MAAKEADKATAQRTTEKTETKQAAKVDAASKAAASKPPPLGYPGGPEIANKDTLLSEVDAALGCKKPPAIEYLFVEPHAGLTLFGLGIPLNPYGHAAIRYTRANGEQIAMNITGVPGGEMVNMMKPEDYLFGVLSKQMKQQRGDGVLTVCVQTHHFHRGAEQGGIYNRAIVSVRIEDYPADLIEDMHYYFTKVQRRETLMDAKFSLMLAPVYNFIASHAPSLFPIAERGNCALWTSRGLREAQAIQHQQFWPKMIWIDTFELNGLKERSNVHVVSYRRVRDAHRLYGQDASWIPGAVSLIAPLQNIGLMLSSYLNLERFADVIVEVPRGSTRAEVRRQADPQAPSAFRYYRYEMLLGACASLWAFTTILRKLRGPQAEPPGFKFFRGKHKPT